MDLDFSSATYRQSGDEGDQDTDETHISNMPKPVLTPSATECPRHLDLYDAYQIFRASFSQTITVFVEIGVMFIFHSHTQRTLKNRVSLIRKIVPQHIADVIRRWYKKERKKCLVFHVGRLETLFRGSAMLEQRSMLVLSSVEGRRSHLWRRDGPLFRPLSTCIGINQRNV